MLSSDTKSALRNLAIRAAKETLSGQTPSELDAAIEEEPRGGAFVALAIGDGRLGFMGSLRERPLGSAVVDAARMAAADPRYSVEPSAAEHLEVRVCVSGPPRELADGEDLRDGEGVLVRHGLNRGVYLPGLPLIGAGPRGVLAAACVAADLHPEAWTRPEAELLAFPVEWCDEPAD